jgi:hypothetical protein
MSRNVVWLKKSYGEYFNIPPADLPVINTRLVIEKPTDGAIEAREDLIVPMVARPDTLEDHIESLSDDEEDDFIADKKVLIKLKKTVPPSPDFLKISNYLLLIHCLGG